MNIMVNIIGQINQINIVWRYIIAIASYTLSIIFLNIPGVCIQALQVADYADNTTIVITRLLIQSIVMLMFFIVAFLFQENKCNILQNLQTDIASLAIYIAYIVFNLLSNILYGYIVDADKYPLYIGIFIALIRVGFSCAISIYNDKNISLNKVYINIVQIILYIILYGSIIILSPKEQYIWIFWSIVYGFTLFMIDLMFQTAIQANTTKLADALNITKPDIINFGFYSNLLVVIPLIVYIAYDFLSNTTSEHNIISAICSTLISNKASWIIITSSTILGGLFSSFALYFSPLYILQPCNIVAVAVFMVDIDPYIKISNNIPYYIIYGIIIFIIISVIRMVVDTRLPEENKQIDELS